MQVEIWSDVVCTWCYLGERRFEQALGAFEQKDEVEVTYRSFELDPTVPNLRRANTRDAHRLLQLAKARQSQPELMERLHSAYRSLRRPDG
jgi:predicted DsbA family dithiol-disulfide isomerase